MNVKTFEQIRDDSLASRTFAMNLLVGFSVVGSVLTLVGLYGILSLSVTSRRRELAIRTAIGADQRDIHRLILGEGFRLIVGGIGTGLAIRVAPVAGAEELSLRSRTGRSGDADRSGRGLRGGRDADLLGADAAD